MFVARVALITALALVAAFVGVSSISSAAPARAADLSQFQPGNIISDALFFNGSAMNSSEVQNFLNSKLASSCRSGYTCLKDYSEVTASIPANPMCGAYNGGGSESAATIIYKVGQLCGISQKALIVILQKEQGLITDTWPTSSQYSAAMGALCPDTAPCDSAASGFFKQVYTGAYLLKRYTQPAGTGAGTDYSSRYDLMYPVGAATNILYNPNSSCGTKSVFVQNQATHVLYVYTPYTPNAAALAAGYGVGDSCSAYGNRNFFNYYSDWFGSTAYASRDLIAGEWQTAIGSAGKVGLSGWVLEKNLPTSTANIKFTIDGIPSVLSAGLPSAASGSTVPGAGSNHGFYTEISAAAGSHRICGYPQVSGGNEVDWGCTNVIVPAAASIAGAWQSLDGANGQITTSGWLLYPSSPSSTASVVFTIDGVRQTAVVANGSNSGSLASYPGAGSSHGFSVSIPASAGSHRICGYPQTSAGADYDWGCTYVTVP